MSWSKWKNKCTSIKGYLSRGEAELLYRYASQTPQNGVLVEIGSYLGRSSACVGAACVETNRKLYCFDTWNGNDSDFDERDYFQKWINNIKLSGLQDYVFPIVGDSSTNLTSFSFDRGIDFVFVDGCHTYEGVSKDVSAFIEKLNEGAIVIFHDSFKDGVNRAWQETKHVFKSANKVGSIFISRM